MVLFLKFEPKAFTIMSISFKIFHLKEKTLFRRVLTA